MQHLAARDLGLAFEVLAEIEAAEGLDAFARAIPTLARLIPADVVSYNELNPARGRVVVVANPPDVLTPQVVEAAGRNIAAHPALRYYQATSDGRALLLSDFWSRRQVRASALYQECYRLIDGNFQIVTALLSTAPAVIGLAFFRRGRDFSERDRAVLNLVRPHLAAAYRAAEATTARTRIEEALAAAGRHLITVEGPDGAVCASPEALALLESAFGATGGPDGRLPSPVSAWIAAHRGTGPSGTVSQLVKLHDGFRLTLKLLRARGPGRADMLLAERDPLVSSVDELIRPELSPREREVLAQVATGRTNAQIAATLGVTVRTVRKHVENIFGKLGVKTRTAAAALALSVARVPD